MDKTFIALLIGVPSVFALATGLLIHQNWQDFITHLTFGIALIVTIILIAPFISLFIVAYITSSGNPAKFFLEIVGIIPEK